MPLYVDDAGGRPTAPDPGPAHRVTSGSGVCGQSTGEPGGLDELDQWRARPPAAVAYDRRVVDAPLGGWVVIVPVKGLASAKSRLAAPSAVRSGLALAFALDAVAVALACPAVDAVLVVTADDEVAGAVMALGVRVVSEVPAEHDPLNSAIRSGLRAAADSHPRAPIAVLTSDLPALDGDTLADALAQAEGHPLAMVTDAAAEGTTMLTARPGEPLTPRFGTDSRRLHEQAGHVVLLIPDGSRIRHDVDTAADLDVALRLGVGLRTRSAMAQLERISPARSSAADAIAADSTGPDR